MSILNGNISGSVIYPEPQGFGEAMVPRAEICEPSVTVAALGEDILICGGARIALYRIAKDGEYSFISSLEICGRARQIAVKDGFAFVTSRENGIYVCDLTVPESPRLIYNIDTVELATGICVAGDILAVTNRHMGCELFDVSTPQAPRKISDFMCGEAQSVCLYGHYAIIGDWMNKRGRIFDISDPNDIRELSQMYVDGFADGVCTLEKDGKIYCAVATGHHSARLRNRRKYEEYTYVTAEMLSEGYGCGHGVELFDITIPESPEWVSSVKAPPLFGGLDTWLVFTDGKRIAFTDSMNGIFIISVEDIRSPRIDGYFKLPPTREQRLSPPSVQVQTGAITSSAVVSGFLCTASEQNGIQLLSPSAPLGAFLPQRVSISLDGNAAKVGNAFYKSSGQVHAFAEYGDRIYCASGNAGIEVLDKSGVLLFAKETKGICRDVIVYNNVIIAAESSGGVAIYEPSDLTELSRYSAPDFSCRQLTKTKKGICAVSGIWEVLFLGIDDELRFSVLVRHRIPGILYHRHLAAYDGKNGALANPLAVGPVVICEKDGKASQRVVFDTQFCPFSDGGCIFGDTLVAIYQGRYLVSKAPFDDYSTIPFPELFLDGQPFKVGDLLVLLNRYNGKVTVLDAANPLEPKLVKHVTLDSHPEFCECIDGRLYAACGFNGICEI